jgi:2-oxoglutarate ferredoxin oxidoreductase subunit gamma
VDTAIILNQQSMDKFEESVKPGGILIYDPNGITSHPTRTDIRIFQIEGTKLAAEMGNKKIFNMVILGGFLKEKPVVKLENVIEGLKKSISDRNHHLIPLNLEAITMGMKNIVPYKVEESIFQN